LLPSRVKGLESLVRMGSSNSCSSSTFLFFDHILNNGKAEQEQHTKLSKERQTSWAKEVCPEIPRTSGHMNRRYQAWPMPASSKEEEEQRPQSLLASQRRRKGNCANIKSITTTHSIQQIFL